MNELNTIQNADTDIPVGEDLDKHKYSFDEVCAIIKQARGEDFINDKELMLTLCDCDRHGDVHLEGCRYLHFKERFEG